METTLKKPDVRLFACLSLLMFANSSILLLLPSFLVLEPTFSRFQHRLKTRSYPGILRNSSTRLQLLRHPALLPEQLHSQPSLDEEAMVALPKQQSVSRPNQFL